MDLERETDVGLAGFYVDCFVTFVHYIFIGCNGCGMRVRGRLVGQKKKTKKEEIRKTFGRL